MSSLLSRKYSVSITYTSTSISVTPPLSPPLLLHRIHININQYNTSTNPSTNTATTLLHLSIVDWEHFKIGVHHYLIASNARHGPPPTPTTTPRTPTLYVWRGEQRFVPSVVEFSAAVGSTSDWESFEVGGSTYMVAARPFSTSIPVYEAVTS